MVSILYHAAFLSMTLCLCKAGFSEVAVIKSKWNQGGGVRSES